MLALALVPGMQLEMVAALLELVAAEGLRLKRLRTVFSTHTLFPPENFHAFSFNPYFTNAF